MGRIEKTVFISYRRANAPWALSIYQDLTRNGYDVFFDYNSIGSGNFERVILDSIRARAHFLVVLTPTALERCHEPGDWLRREVETAIDEGRNIVPLVVEGFDFSDPVIDRALTGKLRQLKTYNQLRIFVDYFEPGMEKLRTEYLNKALDDIPLQPLSSVVETIADRQKADANREEPVTEGMLTSQVEMEAREQLRTRRVPVIGKLVKNERAPAPGPDFNYYDAENTVEIVPRLLPRGDTGRILFALEVQGDSFKDALLRDGDYIIVRPAKEMWEVNGGDMVLVWLPRRGVNELRYYHRWMNDWVSLQAVDRNVPPLKVSTGEPMEVRARVVMVIRKTPELENSDWTPPRKLTLREILTNRGGD